jgi:hypothetical protein
LKTLDARMLLNKSEPKYTRKESGQRRWIAFPDRDGLQRTQAARRDGEIGNQFDIQAARIAQGERLPPEGVWFHGTIHFGGAGAGFPGLQSPAAQGNRDGLAPGRAGAPGDTPREEGKQGAGGASEVEMISPGVVEIDGPFHQAQAEERTVEIESRLGTGGDCGNVVEAVKHGNRQFRIFPDAGGKRGPNSGDGLPCFRPS